MSHPYLLSLLSQTLPDSEPLLCESEGCLALLSEAQSRQDQYSSLLTDARPATTQSYIYIHKTEENGEIRHTFCYCLETDQWKDLGTGCGEGKAGMPDPPGSCLTSYAEKVCFGVEPSPATVLSSDPLKLSNFNLEPLITSPGVGMGCEQYDQRVSFPFQIVSFRGLKM